MNDFNKNSNDPNFPPQSNNGQFNKKSKTTQFKDVLIGLGISGLLVLLMFFSLFIGKNVGIVSIIEFIIISYGTFLSVRFIRRKRHIIGVFILATIIPSTLLLLLVGTCAGMLGGL